ncbi:MAG: diacylglycerol kinase family protein [Planctomycetes bacterium]|nr:diacylglycerol kinase family protein [Planctomycetota bacterium]
MNKTPPNQPSSFLSRWRRKFACALRGIAVGVRGQSSFWVHFPAAIVVVVMATWLQISRTDWLALVVCMTIVFSAELFNSAIEHLARAITREQHPEIRDALDVASGAVLVAAMGAAVVGVGVLGWPLLEWFL